MKGREIFWVTLIVSRGKSIVNHGVHGDGSPLLGDFPSLNKCISVCPGGIKLYLIKYPGGVVVLLLTSWGNNALTNDCPGGMTAI